MSATFVNVFIDLFLLLTLQEGRACRATTRCTGTRYSAAPTAPRCGSSSRSFITYRDSLRSVITRSLHNKILIDSWAFLFLSLQLTAHFHPSVSLFAKTILQVEHLVDHTSCHMTGSLLWGCSVKNACCLHRGAPSSTLETRCRTSPSSASWTALSSRTPNSWRGNVRDTANIAQRK